MCGPGKKMGGSVVTLLQEPSERQASGAEASGRVIVVALGLGTERGPLFRVGA